jgi:DNA repair protein RecO (recombination protein O)
MVVSTSAIVISKLKYRDNDLILKLLTRELGVCSFLVRNPAGKKRNKIINYFQPLSILNIEFENRNKSNLNYLKDVEIKYLFKSIHFDIKKSVVVLFISEILSKILNFQEKDELLFEFISDSLVFFDKNNSHNFHLIFLIHLTKYFGLFPQTDNIEGLYFDLEQGVFSFEKPPKHYITGLNLDIFKRLLGIKFDHVNNINISNNMRRDLIDDIITYYKYHFESFSNLKSIDVIRKTLI